MSDEQTGGCHVRRQIVTSTEGGTGRVGGISMEEFIKKALVIKNSLGHYGKVPFVQPSITAVKPASQSVRRNALLHKTLQEPPERPAPPRCPALPKRSQNTHYHAP
ncbi:hypothetical protein JTB14_007127 [Gonioctena quinquepunctata]|nr:hypothetical protein JTB14_007127 [Gonioctena quinquepunctata]